MTAPVAFPDFAARLRAWEEEGLSALAVRSYPAVRREAEEECSLRTPFQRDRDRIVHCKAFRRLKHKTQVFVAPEGDHYRTRLTHTLETTQISRTVARALRLERGPHGGHRPGARPRPPAVRAHRRGRARPRAGASASAAGSATTSTRCASWTSIERLNLTEPVRDGILRHTSGDGGAREPRGPHRAARGPDRLHQPRHRRRAARRGHPRGGPPARASSRCWATRAPSGSTRWSTTWSSTPSAAGDIVQGEAVGGAMLRLRAFMFDRVYLGPTARAEHAKIERVLRGLFDWYCEAPGRAARPASRARRTPSASWTTSRA